MYSRSGGSHLLSDLGTNDRAFAGSARVLSGSTLFASVCFLGRLELIQLVGVFTRNGYTSCEDNCQKYFAPFWEGVYSQGAIFFLIE